MMLARFFWLKCEVFVLFEPFELGKILNRTVTSNTKLNKATHRWSWKMTRSSVTEWWWLRFVDQHIAIDLWRFAEFFHLIYTKILPFGKQCVSCHSLYQCKIKVELTPNKFTLFKYCDRRSAFLILVYTFNAKQKAGDLLSLSKMCQLIYISVNFSSIYVSQMSDA